MIYVIHQGNTPNRIETWRPLDLLHLLVGCDECGEDAEYECEHEYLCRQCLVDRVLPE